MLLRLLASLVEEGILIEARLRVNAVPFVSIPAVSFGLLLLAPAATAVPLLLALFLAMLFCALVVHIQLRVLFDQSLVDLVAEFAVRAQLDDVGSDDGDQLAVLRFLGHGQALLEHVVAVLVAEQVEELVLLLEHTSNQLEIDFVRVILQALLNHVAAEFLPGKRDQIGHQLASDDLIRFLDLQFQHELNHVVAKRIFDEG